MTDDDLIRQFEDCSLPFDEWTHRMHVRVAFSYLERHPFDEAVQKMREGVQRYNAHNAVPEGLLMGYHDTITVAFMRIIATQRIVWAEMFPAADSESFCDQHPQLMQRRILRLFYSGDRLGSAEAKAAFVEPDLTALPMPPGSGSA